MIRQSQKDKEYLRDVTRIMASTMIYSEYVRRVDGRFIADSERPRAMNFNKTMFQLPISSNLSISLILTLHRALLMSDLPEKELGKLRNVQVKIINGSGFEGKSNITPPHEIVASLESLFERWNLAYDKIKGLSDRKKLEALSLFHYEFLTIHPFIDGNGRVARFLMIQQGIDLLHEEIIIEIEVGEDYINALKLADEGNIQDLINTIVDKYQL